MDRYVEVVLIVDASCICGGCVLARNSRLRAETKHCLQTIIDRAVNQGASNGIMPNSSKRSFPEQKLLVSAIFASENNFRVVGPMDSIPKMLLAMDNKENYTIVANAESSGLWQTSFELRNVLARALREFDHLSESRSRVSAANKRSRFLGMHDGDVDRVRECDEGVSRQCVLVTANAVSLTCVKKSKEAESLIARLRERKVRLSIVSAIRHASLFTLFEKINVRAVASECLELRPGNVVTLLPKPEVKEQQMDALEACIAGTKSYPNDFYQSGTDAAKYYLAGENDVAHVSNEDAKRNMERMATEHGSMAVNRRDFEVNEGEPQLNLANSDVRFDNHNRQAVGAENDANLRSDIDDVADLIADTAALEQSASVNANSLLLGLPNVSATDVIPIDNELGAANGAIFEQPSYGFGQSGMVQEVANDANAFGLSSAASSVSHSAIADILNDVDAPSFVSGVPSQSINTSPSTPAGASHGLRHLLSNNASSSPVLSAPAPQSATRGISPTGSQHTTPLGTPASSDHTGVASNSQAPLSGHGLASLLTGNAAPLSVSVAQSSTEAQLADTVNTQIPLLPSATFRVNPSPSVTATKQLSPGSGATLPSLAGTNPVSFADTSVSPYLSTPGQSTMSPSVGQQGQNYRAQLPPGGDKPLSVVRPLNAPAGLQQSPPAPGSTFSANAVGSAATLPSAAALIWSGQVEISGTARSPPRNIEIYSTDTSSAQQDRGLLGCSHWSSAKPLVLRLVPQNLITNPSHGQPFLQNARHVLLNIEGAPPSTCGLLMLPNPLTELRVIVVLWSEKRRMFGGIIPNNQSQFLESLTQMAARVKRDQQAASASKF